MTVPWRWRRRAARLARHLPAQSVRAVLGDVLEEYGDRLAHGGRWRAELWLARELSSLTRAYRRSALGPSRGSASRRVEPAELAQAVRALARAPWYALTLAGVIALSLALGATVFAVVDGVLFKPLPYGQSDRLFVVAPGHSELPEPAGTFAQIPEAELREWTRALPDMKLTGWGTSRFKVVGERDSVRSVEIDSAFLDVVGMRPAAGGFAASDFDVATPVRPALITRDFWRARFAGDRARGPERHD